MSVVAESQKLTPLGSFLKKMEVNPSEKTGEVKAEVKPTVAEVTHAAPNLSTDLSVKPEIQPAPATETKVGTNEPVGEPKPDDKPKDDKIEKRLKDAQSWGNEEHKARLAAEQRERDLQTQLQRIEQKLDGTYEEPQAPSVEQANAEGDARGRIRASHHAAVRQFGKEFVMSTVWDAESPYQELQKDPRIRDRVMEADDPVMEAIAVVKEHQDAQKYGRTPEEIRKKLEEELKPKLTQEILEGLKARPGPATSTLGNVRGSSERTQQDNAPAGLSLAKVFPWGASRT